METPRSRRSPAVRHQQEHTDLCPAQLAGCAAAWAQSAAPAGRAQHGSGWSPGWGDTSRVSRDAAGTVLLSSPLHFAKRTREAASPCQGETAETFRLHHHPLVFPSVVTQHHLTEPESPPAKSHRAGGVATQGCSRDLPPWHNRLQCWNRSTSRRRYNPTRQSTAQKMLLQRSGLS